MPNESFFPSSKNERVTDPVLERLYAELKEAEAEERREQEAEKARLEKELERKRRELEEAKKEYVRTHGDPAWVAKHMKRAKAGEAAGLLAGLLGATALMDSEPSSKKKNKEAVAKVAQTPTPSKHAPNIMHDVRSMPTGIRAVEKAGKPSGSKTEAVRGKESIRPTPLAKLAKFDAAAGASGRADTVEVPGLANFHAEAENIPGVEFYRAKELPTEHGIDSIKQYDVPEFKIDIPRAAEDVTRLEQSGLREIETGEFVPNAAAPVAVPNFGIENVTTTDDRTPIRINYVPTNPNKTIETGKPGMRRADTVDMSGVPLSPVAFDTASEAPLPPAPAYKYPEGTVSPQSGEIVDSTTTFDFDDIGKPAKPKSREETKPASKPGSGKSGKIKVENTDEKGNPFDETKLKFEKRKPLVITPKGDTSFVVPRNANVTVNVPGATVSKAKPNEKVTVTYSEPEEEDAPTQAEIDKKASDSSIVFNYSTVEAAKIDPNRSIDTLGKELNNREYGNFTWTWKPEDGIGYTLKPVETPTGEMMGQKEFKVIDAWVKTVNGLEFSKKDLEERFDTVALNELKKYPSALRAYIHNSVQKESIGAYAIEVENLTFVINKDGMLAFETASMPVADAPIGRYVIKLVSDKNGRHLEMNGKKLEAYKHMPAADMERFIESCIPGEDSKDGFFYMYVTNETPLETSDASTVVQALDPRLGKPVSLSLKEIHDASQADLDSSRRRHKAKYFVMQVENTEHKQNFYCVRELSQKRIRTVSKVIGSRTNGTFKPAPSETDFVPPKQSAPKEAAPKPAKHGGKRKGSGEKPVRPDDFRKSGYRG